MAKQLKFTLKDRTWEAGITKVDRDKVYGYIEERVTDPDGNPCTAGNLMDDGKTLILQGEVALKTVDASLNEVDKSTLKAVWPDGREAVKQPSSFDTGIALEQASLDDLFSLEVNSVYQLEWEDEALKADIIKYLEGGKVLRAPFRYRADYESSDSVLITAQNEVFILSGRFAEFEFLENKAILLDEGPDAQPGEEDEIDFGML